MLQQHKKSLNNTTSGFLLISCMITLCLMLIAVYSSSYYATVWYTLQSRAELEHMYAVFLYAQQKARITGSNVTMQFDQAAQSYSCEQRTHKLARHLKFGAHPASKGPPSHPEKVISEPITFEKMAAICYPDGSIQAGTVYLLDTKTNIGYALTVPIGHATYLKQYQFSSGWTALS